MDVDVRAAMPPKRPVAFLKWLWRLILDIADEYQKDGVGDLAASITFWTLLSIPAAALALVSTLSSLEGVAGARVAENVRNAVVDFVGDTFRDDEGTITETVNDLFSNSSTGVATAATLVAVFTLSRAFAGLIRAFDNAYGVEEGRPWWYLRIVAIGLGLGTIIITAASATLLVAMPFLELSGESRIGTGIVIFIGVTLWVATMFHLAPNHRTPFRLDVPGAILTSIGWTLVVQGFSLYIQLTSSGNEVQSSVGAVLLALTLLYAMAVILLVGAELNDVLAQRTGSATLNTHVNDKLRTARERIRR